MENSVTSNQRIAKNTLVLYLRMFFMMAVSLYTSRVTLDALGIDDFGLYNVVGGIVIVMSFVSSAMTGAIQRYVNYEMGKGYMDGMKKVFSSTLVIQFILAILIMIIAETIGLWFFYEKMNINADRVEAALYVYQCSIIVFVINILNVPYNAAIIAHERMSAFAFISVFEAMLKLAIAYIIMIFPFDRLVFYAFGNLSIGLLSSFLYGIYCTKCFEEAKFRKSYVDKIFIREISSFTSWTIFGNLAFILHTQGISIVVNMFFGAAVNAAQGISNQINGAVTQFVSNFQMALKPQLVKSYAAKEYAVMHTLIFRGCRLSFYLIAILTVPLVVYTPEILNLWLVEVPDFSTEFVRSILLVTVVNCYAQILGTAQTATGYIKSYNVVLTMISLLHIPSTLLLFYFGYSPYWCNIVYIIITILAQVVRVYFVAHSTSMSQVIFYKKVVVPNIVIYFSTMITTIVIRNLLPNIPVLLLIKCGISCLLSMILIYIVGLQKEEKEFVHNVIKKRIR